MIMYFNCMDYVKILAQVVLQIFCSQGLYGLMPNSEKRNNSVKFLQSFMKSYSGDLHHVSKLCARYYDPSSSGSPDILFTGCFTTKNDKVGKGEKGDNSVKYLENFANN